MQFPLVAVLLRHSVTVLVSFYMHGNVLYAWTSLSHSHPQTSTSLLCIVLCGFGLVWIFFKIADFLLIKSGLLKIFFVVCFMALCIVVTALKCVWNFKSDWASLCKEKFWEMFSLVLICKPWFFSEESTFQVLIQKTQHL